MSYPGTDASERRVPSVPVRRTVCDEFTTSEQSQESSLFDQHEMMPLPVTQILIPFQCISFLSAAYTVISAIIADVEDEQFISPRT